MRPVFCLVLRVYVVVIAVVLVAVVVVVGVFVVVVVLPLLLSLLCVPPPAALSPSMAKPLALPLPAAAEFQPPAAETQPRLSAAERHAPSLLPRLACLCWCYCCCSCCCCRCCWCFCCCCCVAIIVVVVVCASTGRAVAFDGEAVGFAFAIHKATVPRGGPSIGGVLGAGCTISLVLYVISLFIFVWVTFLSDHSVCFDFCC